MQKLAVKKTGLFLAASIILSISTQINASNIKSELLVNKKLSRASYLALATTIVNFLSRILGGVNAQTTITPIAQTSLIAQQTQSQVATTNATIAQTINPTGTTTEISSPTGAQINLPTQTTIANQKPINQTLATFGAVLSDVSAVLTTINTVYQATHQNQIIGQKDLQQLHSVQVLSKNF